MDIEIGQDISQGRMMIEGKAKAGYEPFPFLNQGRRSSGL